MEFTPRIAQEWFCCATGPKAFYDSCEILFKPHCIDFTAGWTTLVKARREVSTLLENNAFSRAYRSKQLPEQKVYVSAGENNSGGLSVQQVNLLFSAAKKTLIFFNARFGQIQDFSSGPRPCGYHIYTLLGWEISMYPCRAQGKAQFSLPGPTISCSDSKTGREREQDTSTSWWMSGLGQG